MKPLKEKVALVAGATRGAGRGIARMLGEGGATVYCTGRSSRRQRNTSGHHYADRPETIEETAEMVAAAGGVGIAVRVDHAVEAEVVELFERVKNEKKRLDILVNVLTGPPVKSWSPFREPGLRLHRPRRHAAQHLVGRGGDARNVGRHPSCGRPVAARASER